MPYRRKSSSYRARRRTVRSAKRLVSRRRISTKRTTYRKKGAMSKKRILNISSRKKRNGMLTMTNANDAGTVGLANNRIANLIVSTNSYRGIWLATAQDLVDGDGNATRVSQQSARTSTTCYMRGLGEHIRIQTSSGIPWFWRRICFTYKGPTFSQYDNRDTPIQIEPNSMRYQDTSNGMQRLFFNQNLNNTPLTIDQEDDIIFKGRKNVDWTDPIIAPLDTARITVKYDKTRTIRSGNERGTVKEFKMWHPMNKNLVYGDDEIGDKMTTTFRSVPSKAGMGDYYVMDIITPGSGAVTSDQLLVQANSTLYWHEK